MDASIPPLPETPVTPEKVKGSGLRRKIFDALLGIIIPILLILFDPVVFRGSASCDSVFGTAYLSQYQIFAYLALIPGILVLLIWLLFGDALPAYWKAFVAGILWAGALFALGIGIVLIPYSVIGLLALIGALGFIPFITAFVYFRNGRRAYSAAIKSARDPFLTVAVVLLSGILVLGIPALVQWQVTDTIQSVTHTIFQNVDKPDLVTITALKQLNERCLHLCTNAIQTAFNQTIATNPDSRQAMTLIYWLITGKVLFDPHSCGE